MRQINQQPNSATPMQRRTMVYSTVADHASVCSRTWELLGSFLDNGINKGGPRFT